MTPQQLARKLVEAAAADEDLAFYTQGMPGQTMYSAELMERAEFRRKLAAALDIPDEAPVPAGKRKRRKPLN